MCAHMRTYTRTTNAYLNKTSFIRLKLIIKDMQDAYAERGQYCKKLIKT